MLLISGLGNPGLKYKNTLHNLGFMVLDELGTRFEKKKKKKKCGAKIATMANPYHEDSNKISLVKSILGFKKNNFKLDIVLAKPQTYMNLSGKSIACLKERYGIKNNNIIIIFDDLNLERGQIRVRAKGSSGGHKGLQSIIEEIETENFPRFRVGIGPFKDQRGFTRREDYVLSQIKAKDKAEYDNMVNKTADAIEFYFKEGIERTMSKYNLKG